MNLALLATTMPQRSDEGGGGLISNLITLVILAVVLVGLWKVFTKAGEPGWACIVPIYNLIVLLKIAGRPMWWFILMLIPLVGLIVGIIVAIDVAKAFGKGTGFGIGLAFLPFVFYPILGFGDAQYGGAPKPKAA